MKTIDLLSPISIGFNDEKTSLEASPAGDTFEEVFARQEQQVGRERGEQPDEGLNGPVGILTNDSDPTSPMDGTSTCQDLTPPHFQGDSEISAQAKGSTSSRPGELSDRLVKATSPQDRAQSDSGGANDCEPRVPMIFLSFPWEPGSSGSAGIQQDELSSLDPVIAVTDSENAGSENPSLPVREGRGLSFPSSPEEGSPAEKISLDMKQDSLSPGIRTENPFSNRTTLLVNSSDKVTSFENPSLSGKGGDGFSFSSSSEEWVSTEGFLFNQKETLKSSGQLDPTGPHGVLPSQGPEGPPDPNPVAGRREDSPSESLRRDSADIEEMKIYQPISRGMVRSFSRHGERIELALDPPELGSLLIEVKRENGSLKAILWTDNPETKSMLENHQTHLHKLLKEDGLALEKFDVVFDQDMRSFHERERAPKSHQGRGEKKSKEDGISALSDPLELRGLSTRAARSGEYSLDLIV